MDGLKRIALSFASVLLFGLVLFVLGTVPTVLSSGPRSALADIQSLALYLLFALPAWVLALPFVLLFQDANGRRLGWIMAIGTAIGPVVILAWMLLVAGALPDWQRDGFAVMVSASISLPTTIIYVLLLRRFTTKTSTTPPSRSPAEAPHPPV